MTLFHFLKGFNANKLSCHLKMALNRLKIAEEQTLYKGRAIMVMLEKNISQNDEEKAWLLAESLIREQNLADVYQIVTLECELLQNRVTKVSSCKNCPMELLSCISTILYCFKWLEIPELRAIRKQFRRKYGRKFVQGAVSNRDNVVNERVVSKLSHSISPRLVHEYLTVFHEQVAAKASAQIQMAKVGRVRNKKNEGGNALSAKEPCEPLNRKVTAKIDEEKRDVELKAMIKKFSGVSISSVTSNGNVRTIRNVERPLSTLSPILPLYVFNPNPSLEIAFDVRTKNPVYVMERLEMENKRHGPKGRRPQFFEEKALPEEYRSRLQHYANSGYDRGHLAPAADFGEDEKVKDTFTMCNVSPQIHSMNVSIWSRLEHWCRRVAREEMEGIGGVTHVVTGPLWLPEKQLSKKHYQYSFPAIGDSSTLIQVPTHFFKVVVVMVGNAIRKFACFVVPNAEVDISKKSLEDHVVQWEDIEAMSGLKFFPTHTAKPGWKQAAKAITNSVTSKRSSGTSSLDGAEKYDLLVHANGFRLEHLGLT